ncbi:steroid 17-alpha-hydroxylase/17,20 lyase [Rhipicephalus microplus]|uniref:steroid 17-alpha-hydroxylase/17,20 lyase n=1 Tax=Rhipicephalus microplus TaxID=6941 RepID=UPI003F6CE280
MTTTWCLSSLVDWRWVTTALVFIVTYLLGRFYHHVSRYPKGPFPLPLVGNMLALRNVTDLHAKSTELSKTYGDVFTLWMAHRPMVMLNSYAVIREALVERRHDFAGRFPTRTAVLQNQGNHDIVFEDYNPHWKALRKVALSAVRKYAVSESLEHLCADIVDAFVDSLEEGPQVMDFRKPLFSLFCKVIGVSIYGRRLHEEQDDIERLENINHRFYEISPNGLPSDIAPFLAILYLRTEKKMAAVFRELGEILHRLFSKAEANYIPGSVENFTHAMLAAREEAIKEDKADAQYLTKPSMILATVNLFNAGSNTSTGTLQWLLLRIATEESLQARIRKEIEDNIGSRPPAYGDREKLPFTIACLLETLRMHPATPLGIPHNTTTDTRVGKWDIPKDTGMLYNIYAVHHDPKNWEEPEEFRPERFLDPVTGKVCTDVGPLITFGQGARSCPGEKLAKMDVFYIFVRLVQRLTVSVPSASSDVNWNGKGSSLFLHPARQNIVYTRRR